MIATRVLLFCAVGLIAQASCAQDLPTGSTLTLPKVAQFNFAGGEVETIASSPDQKWLSVGWKATKVQRGGAQLVDAVTFKPGPIFDIGKGGSNSDADFTADSKYLVTLSFEKTLRIWDPATGRMLGQGSKPSWDWLVVCHPNSKECISAGGQAEIRRWEIPTGRLLSETNSGFQRIIGLDISRDGKTLVLLGRSDPTSVSMQIRSYPELKVIHNTKLVSGTGMHSQITIAPDGRHLAYTLSGGEGDLSVVDIQTGKRIRQFSGWMTRCNDLMFLNNRVVIGHGWRRSPRIADIQSGEMVILNSVVDVGGSGMAINRAGGSAKLLLGHAGGETKTVSVWRLPAGLAGMQSSDEAITSRPKPADAEPTPAPTPVPMTRVPTTEPPVPKVSQPTPPVVVSKAVEPGRLPVPDDETAKSAEAKIRDLLRIPSQGTVDENLPKRLTELSAEEDDTTIRYAMLTIASQLAVRTGDVDVLRSALEQLGDNYQFDRLLVAGRLLSEVRTGTLGSNGRSQFAVFAEKLGDEAFTQVENHFAAGFYDLAIRWTQRDPDKLRQRRKKVTQAKERMVEFRQALPARDQLKNAPDDPLASQTWGSYLCFVHGDWDAGLTLLARSQDTKLKNLATNDLAAEKEPSAWLSVAQQWQEYAEEQSESFAKAGAYAASRYWYEKSLSQLKGLEKLQVKAALKKLPTADENDAVR